MAIDTTRQRLGVLRQSLAEKRQRADQIFAEFRDAPEMAANAPTRFSHVNSLHDGSLNKEKIRDLLQSLGDKRHAAEVNAIALIDPAPGQLTPGKTPASPPRVKTTVLS